MRNRGLYCGNEIEKTGDQNIREDAVKEEV